MRARATRLGRLYLSVIAKTELMLQLPRRMCGIEGMGILELRVRQLAVEGIMVSGFNYSGSKEVSFCEPCTEGKHHQNPFPVDGGKCAEKPLELVHNDVCGKMNGKSFGGAEYFLTFIDDKTSTC